MHRLKFSTFEAHSFQIIHYIRDKINFSLCELLSQINNAFSTVVLQHTEKTDASNLAIDLVSLPQENNCILSVNAVNPLTRFIMDPV